MNLAEELACDGVYPSGPVSAWPQERNEKILAYLNPHKRKDSKVDHATKVKASPSKMAKGMVKTAAQAFMKGKVSSEVREERYNTCKACPAFVEDSKRCSECGCFMEAKTWVGGNPDKLCPLKKWAK